jgi:hypothetical protein
MDPKNIIELVKSFGLAMDDVAVFFDLDGVLADFDAGIKQFGFHPSEELNRSRKRMTPEYASAKDAMYAVLENTDIYLRLPTMPKAKTMWTAFAAAAPLVNTAVPKFGGGEGSPLWTRAAEHKKAWFRREIEEIADDRIIVTSSSRKAEHVGRLKRPLSLLIDDRADNVAAWEAKGGAGLLFKNPDDVLAVADAFRK